jgi:predicted transcriptional regulator
MSSDDTQGDGDAEESVTDRLKEEIGRAGSGFDDGLVDLLSWVLDTETRARIYVELRRQPWGTSDEIAEGTGLYPSTVREALAALHEEGFVERRTREAPGAGNNPYEYTAMAPSELVGTIIEEVQTELNTVFNLDTYLGGDEPTRDPVSITVQVDGGVDAPETGETDASDVGDVGNVSEGREGAESDD